MVAALSDDPPVSNSYQAFFKQCIVRQSGLVLARIEQTGPILPDDILKQALLILDFALDLAEAWPNTRELLLQMAPKMEQAGFRDEWIPYLEQGIYQSQQLGDLAAEAELQLQLGILYQLRSKYEEARIQLESSIQGFEWLHAHRNQAQALNRLAQVAQRQRQFKEVASLVEVALRLLAEHDSERAYSYFVLALVALDKRTWPEAIECCKQAYRLWKKENNQRMMGRSLTILGAALQSMKKYDQAISVYKRAIALLGEVQDSVHKAMAQMNLGNVYLSREQADVALEFYISAQRIFQQVQDQLHLAHVNHNIGLSYRQLQQWAKAEKAYLSAINYWQQLGNIERLVNSLDGLGLVYLGEGQLENAQAIFRKGLNQLTRIEGEPGYEYWFEILTAHLDQASAESAD